MPRDGTLLPWWSRGLQVTAIFRACRAMLVRIYVVVKSSTYKFFAAVAIINIVFYVIAVQKLFNYIDANTSSHMHKRVIFNLFYFPSMRTLVLYLSNPRWRNAVSDCIPYTTPVLSKKNPPLWPLSHGGTKLIFTGLSLVNNLMCEHPLNWEQRRTVSFDLYPFNVVWCWIISIVWECGKGISYSV